MTHMDTHIGTPVDAHDEGHERARPSRRRVSLFANLIDGYVMRTAASSIGLVAIALVALLSLFDFVERLGLVGQGSYNVANALDDMLLTAPSRLLQVAPISMLLGSLLAFGALVRNSELTAMLALGVSEQRIIRSVMLLVFPATLILLATLEFLIPPGERLAYAQRSAALASALQPADPSVWAHQGLEYISVRQLGRGDTAENLEIYKFASDGTLAGVIHADKAAFGKGGDWSLTGVTRTTVHDSQFTTDHPAALAWHAFLTPSSLRSLFLPIGSIPPSELYDQIQTAKRFGQDPSRLQQAFWGLVSIPIAMLAMTMLVASIAFQPARTQSTAQDLTRAMAFSILYSLAQQILGRLGLLLHLSPVGFTLGLPVAVFAFAIWLFRSRFRVR